MRTYEPRQGRKAATVVCSAYAVVTLAFTFIWRKRRERIRWTLILTARSRCVRRK